MKRRLALPLVVLIAVGLFMAFSSRSTHHVPAPPPSPGPSTASAPAVAPHSDVGFHSRERLTEHYRKHGSEFGDVSMEEYLRLAQALRDRPAGGEVVEAVREDGVITRFDRASGAFLAFDSDRTIRTFFKPHDGEAYFRRQLGREHGAR